MHLAFGIWHLAFGIWHLAFGICLSLPISPSRASNRIMAQDILQSYESTPYKTLPHWQTHPDNLAAIAALAGLSPADPHNCRVLELGCATGGNIIPLAVAFPNSRFLGLDLSPSQIDIANRIAQALNLSNISFRAVDLLDVNKDLGVFDYIICHGVFSWVPTPVRDKILWIIQNLLAPHGAANISYNAYPGWHIRSIARDLMAFHAGHFENPADKIANVRGLMNAIDKTIADRESVFGRILSDEARAFDKGDEYYLIHEFLDPINQPYYFHQFASLIQPCNLQWIGESNIVYSHLGHYSKPIEELILSCSQDPQEREQYLDFLINRQFKSSVIAHKLANPDPIWDFSQFERLRYSAQIKWNEKPGGLIEFEAANGKTIKTNHPDMISAIQCVANAWPNTVPFNQIPADLNIRRSLILECVRSGLFKMHFHPIEPASPSDRPRAFPYARLQAQDNLEMVTNLKHASVPLPTFDALVLTLCDGARYTPAIADEIWRQIQQGDFDMTLPNNIPPPAKPSTPC